MSQIPDHDVTRLLLMWGEGDEKALKILMDIVYDELLCLASAFLRKERPDHTLETSALVNEAYLRMVDLKQVTSRDRRQFFSLSAYIIRNILVDHARGVLTAKRGAGLARVSLDEVYTLPVEKAPELIALDDALNDLAVFYPLQAKIVELRHFGGLTQEEIADVLGMSVISVARGWRLAKTWLYAQLAKVVE